MQIVAFLQRFWKHEAGKMRLRHKKDKPSNSAEMNKKSKVTRVRVQKTKTKSHTLRGRGVKRKHVELENDQCEKPEELQVYAIGSISHHKIAT